MESKTGLSKAEILATLRELYLDPDVPAPVRLKAAEVCLGYVEKQERKEDTDAKPRDGWGDAMEQMQSLMDALKD